MGHLAGSINVGLEGRYAEYAGGVVQPGAPIVLDHRRRSRGGGEEPPRPHRVRPRRRLPRRPAARAFRGAPPAPPASFPQVASVVEDVVTDFDPESPVSSPRGRRAHRPVAERARAMERESQQRRRPHALKRPLHTLKGGARMAGLMPMGDLARAGDAVHADRQRPRHGRRRAFRLAQTALDELARMRESVSSGKGVPTANGLIARIHALFGRQRCRAPRRRRPRPRRPRLPPPRWPPPPAPAPARAGLRRRHRPAPAPMLRAAAPPPAPRPRPSPRRVPTFPRCRRRNPRTCRHRHASSRARTAGARRRLGASRRSAFHRDARRGEGTVVRGLQPRAAKGQRAPPMDRCCRRAPCRRAANRPHPPIDPSSRASTRSCSTSCSTTPAKRASRARASSSRSAPSTSTWVSCRAR